MINTRKQSIDNVIINSAAKFIHKEGTGGLLNLINEYFRLNSKANSVPIISLIGAHKPKTGDELVVLIAAHAKGGKMESCSCGCKSAGSLDDFSTKLYNAQLSLFKEHGKEEFAFDYESCAIFMHALFITFSLKGKAVEDAAIKETREYIRKYMKDKNLSVEKASTELDFKYGVDLVIKKDGKILKGVQVKPESYINLKNQEVIATNNAKNAKFVLEYGVDCFYLYYKQDGGFINMHKLYEIIS